MADQRKKFIHFYLTELLHHVKSMNEHRLPPLEYHIVKRLVQFIVTSGDIVEAFDKLKTVGSLTMFCGLIEKNLEKTTDPSFRMSVLMSVLESDSERISQMLQQMLSTRNQQVKLEAELRSVGLNLDLDHLYDLYQAKGSPRAIAPSDTVASERHKESADQDFASVGDVAGFFNRRGRRSPSEVSPVSGVSATVRKKTSGIKGDIPEPVVESTVPPGIFSDAGAFMVELKRLMVVLRAQVNELRDNLQQAEALGEAADGFGELKKLVKVHSFGEVHQLIERLARRFNEIIDNTDERDLTITGKTVDICLHLLDAVEGADYVQYDASKNELVRRIQDLMEEFESSLAVRSRISRVPEAAILAEELGSIGDGSSGEGRDLKLDFSHLSAEDYQIFKDEVYAYFDSLDSALLELRKDRSNLSALRILQLALKGLQTASRVLKFGLFLDICSVAWSGMNDIVRRKATLSEAAHRHLVSLRSVLRLFTEGKSVSETSYNELRQLLQVLAETPAETPVAADEERPSVLPESRVETSDVGWIDDVQGIIDAHKQTRSALIPPAEETAVGKVEEPISTKPKTEPDQLDVDASLVESDIRPAKSASRTKAVQATVKAIRSSSSDLLDLMASEGASTDLSLVRLESFVDRINEEPADIPETKGRKGLAIKKRKIKRSQAETAMASDVPAESERSLETDSASGILLQETHFGQVDAEILEIFIQESEGFFRAFERALEKMSTNLKDESAIKEFERTGHSLKSSSRMLGFDRISGLAGVLELISERYFEKEIELTPELHVLFKDIVAALTALFKRSKTDVRSILERLIALERKLSAPNILTRNIPGAAEYEKQLAETAAATGKNYFESLGVDEEIVQIFREESSSYFRLITHSLEALQSDRNRTSAVRDIEKTAHSLRSSAKMLGFLKISDLMRPVESLTERINKGHLRVTDQVLASLKSLVGVLETLLRGQDVDVSAAVAQLNSALESTPVEESGKTGNERTLALEQMQTQIDEQPSETGTSGRAGTKKSKRAVRKTSVEIPDFQIQNEPIFKRLHVEEALLDEMAQTTAASRGA